MSRRRAIGAGAGLLAAGLIPHGRAVMAQDGARELHTAWPYQSPPTGHFNTFIAETAILVPAISIYGDLIYQPLGMYYWDSGTWLPLLATDWSFLEDGETFAITLREGVVWSDDTPFTARDYEATLWCLRIRSDTLWQYIDEVTVVDDYTVHLHMRTPSTVVERYAIRTAVPRPASVFGEWADRARELFEDGKTLDDPEGRQLLDQFNQFRPDPATVPATGPFIIDPTSITSAQMTLVRNDKAWNADQVLFDRIVNYNGETETVTPVVLGGDVDYATQVFSPAAEARLLEEGFRILRPPLFIGPALVMNFTRHGDTLGDPAVRRAIARAIDRQRTATIARGESGVAIRYMTGMSDVYVTNWVTDDAIGSLDQYEHDPELAAAQLEEAGWRKDGDVWVMRNGEEARFELTFPAEWADWSATGTDVAEQLTDFGIVTEARAVTFTQQPIDVDQGNFDLALASWGNTHNPHPHFSYVTAFFERNTLARNNGGEGIAFDLVQETDVAGEVDLERLTIDSALGLDEQAQRDNITIIARVFNELLPKIPLFEGYGNNAALEGVRVAAWPADDDPILQNSPYADGIPTMLMYTGELKPAGGS
jgi:peptide/nickel transport system substrate-binding protein